MNAVRNVVIWSIRTSIDVIEASTKLVRLASKGLEGDGVPLASLGPCSSDKIQDTLPDILQDVKPPEAKRSAKKRASLVLRGVLGQISDMVLEGPGLSFVILALAVAWATEWLQSSRVIPVFAATYVVWQFARRQAAEELSRAKQQWEQEYRDNTPETAPESAEWLNRLLRLLWRNVYEPKLALQLCNKLQRKLNKSRPKFMETLEFTNFALGTAPPAFGAARMMKHKGDEVLEMDISFDTANPEVAIESRMKLGSLFYVPGSVTAVIKVTSFHISGRLRLRPIASERVLLVSLTGEPKLHIDISLWGISMKALQPILHWMASTIKGSIAKQFQEPRRFCMELGTVGVSKLPRGRAEGGSMRVSLRALRSFEGAPLLATGGQEVGVRLKLRGVKVRSRLVASSEEGGHTLFVPPDDAEDHDFKLSGNTGTLSLIFSFVKEDFTPGAMLGECSIQHKWMREGATCYWHNLRGAKPFALRTSERYTTWVPVLNKHGEEIAEACIASQASWFYGDAPVVSVSEPVSKKEAASARVVDNVLASREGFWIITLVEARELVARDSNGKSDPYCKLKMGRKKKVSKVKSKTLAPKWNETFSFSQGTKLTLTCMDHDMFGFDNDFLGVADIDLAQYKDGLTHDVWIPLQATESGEVHLRILFEKRTDASRASGIFSPLRSLRTNSAPEITIPSAESFIAPVPLDGLHYEPGSPKGGGDNSPTSTPGSSSRSFTVPTTPLATPLRVDSYPLPKSPLALPERTASSGSVSELSSSWRNAESLVVTLVEASNLVIKDFLLKKSDPFCKLKLGKQARKSSVQSGNLNPVWNEVFEFQLDTAKLNPSEPILTVECRDKDLFRCRLSKGKSVEKLL